jgi:hypothetical protein
LEEFTAAQVWERLCRPEHAGDDVRAGELRAAVPNALKEYLDRGEGAFNQRLGSKFRELADRLFGAIEIRIERAEDDRHTKVARWRLVAKGDVDMVEE